MQQKTVDQAKGLSGKGWMRKILKTADIIIGVAEVLVAGPLKLPLKLFQAVRYLNVIANVVKVVGKEADPDE